RSLLLIPDPYLLRLDGLPEKVGRDLVEVFRHRGDKHLMPGLATAGAQARMIEMTLDLRGGRGGRIHQDEGFRIYTLDGRLEEWIVSTAEDQRVGADTHDVGQIAAQDRFRMWRVRLSGFDDVDQLRAGLLIDPHHGVQLLDGVEVLLAPRPALGRDHSDPAALGRVDRRLGSWPDHTHERDLEELSRL